MTNVSLIDQARVIDRHHNEPPSDELIMIDSLEKAHDDILGLYRLTIAKADEMPKEVENDEDQAKVGDYIKKLTSCKKMLDATRESEKAPHLLKGRIIDNFFKARMENIDNIKKMIEEPAAKYAKLKEDRARRQREEKARIEREEAEAKMKAAQEAERIAREAAAEAQRKQAEAERIQREERERAEKAAAEARRQAEIEAERIRREAEQKAAAAKAEVERLEREKAEAIAAKERSEAEAVEAEKRHKEAAAKAALDAAQAEINRKQAEKEAAEKLKEAERQAKEIEREAREKIKAAEEDAKDARKDLRDATRESNAALDDALRQDKFAGRAEKQTLAKGSELSRTRGDTSMSSVSETWVGSVISREELDLEALREHLPMDALTQAVNSFVRAGGRQLAGAIITEETRFNVRG